MAKITWDNRTNIKTPLGEDYEWPAAVANEVKTTVNTNVDLIEPNTWYVNDGDAGDNANVGSDKFPFKTIQHAHDAMADGDTIIIQNNDFNQPSTPATTITKNATIIGYASNINEQGSLSGSWTITAGKTLMIDALGTSSLTFASSGNYTVELSNGFHTGLTSTSRRLVLIIKTSWVFFNDPIELNSIEGHNSIIDGNVNIGSGFYLSATNYKGDIIAGIDSTGLVQGYNSTIDGDITVTGSLKKINSVITGTETVSGTTTDKVQTPNKLDKLSASDQSVVSNVEFKNGILLNGGFNDLSKALAFGDGDTGFFELADDTLYVTIGNSNRFIFLGNSFKAFNSSGGAILNATASDIQPTVFARNNDVDTGMGSFALDVLSFITGGIEAIRVEAAKSTFKGGILIGGTPGALVGGLTFGDGDTGFFELSDDTLYVTIGNSNRFIFIGNSFKAFASRGGSILNATASDIQPTLFPAGNDVDTGIGSAGVDILSFIAGGIEGHRITELLGIITNLFTGSYGSKAVSVDALDPGAGEHQIFQPDGTDSGEDGDVWIKRTDSLGNTILEPLSAGSVSLQLPEFLDAVTGDIIQIYYSSMVRFPNWQSFYFLSNLSGGDDLKRYVELDPSSAGDVVLTVEVYDEKNTLRDTETTTIRVRDSVQQPGTTVNYWNVGDSLTASSLYVDEMHRRLTGTGGTPAGDNYGNIVQHIEGNTGEDWDWYVNDEASPFVYSGVLDFEQYRIDNALAVPQVLYILLTWNGMATDRTQAQWDAWDDDVYTFIDALRADFPSVEVKLMSPNFPPQDGGLGNTYGAAFASLSNEIVQNKNILKQAEIYERIKGEASYSAWVEHINIALVVDAKYNMTSVAKDVNTRNSSAQENFANNGVHPATSGYYQIADAGYRNFIGNYCQ